MASIDAATASFAAPLALAAGGSAPDLGKIGGGPVCRSSQSFLLGKPLIEDANDVPLVTLKKKTGRPPEVRTRANVPVTAIGSSVSSPRDKGKGKPPGLLPTT